MYAQVDYSKDEQWHAWNQDALKRFLTRNDQPLKQETVVPEIGQDRQLAEEPKWETVKGSWWPSSTNPAATKTPQFLEEKPDLLCFESVFAECNQAVALEDDMWEIATVRESFFVACFDCRATLTEILYLVIDACQVQGRHCPGTQKKQHKDVTKTNLTNLGLKPSTVYKREAWWTKPKQNWILPKQCSQQSVGPRRYTDNKFWTPNYSYLVPTRLPTGQRLTSV
jgi:hypothetical protein